MMQVPEVKRVVLIDPQHIGVVKPGGMSEEKIAEIVSDFHQCSAVTRTH